MDPNNESEFQDKEIEKVAAEIKKTDRKEFGETFKSAANRLGTDPEPAPIIGNPISTRIDQLVQKPAVVDSFSQDSNLTPEQKELYSIVKPLRTYERDVADAVRNKNASVTSVKIAAEVKKVELKKKGEFVEKTERVGKKGLVIALSVTLLLAAVGIGGFVFNFFANKPQTPVTQTTSSVITTDAKQTIDTTGKSETDLISAIQNELTQNPGQNNLTRIDLTENISGKDSQISSQKFFELFAKDAPSSLGRALGNEWVFGFHSTTKNEPFIFTTVSSFDNAYDGMLRFEKNIVKDFGPIFVKSENVNQQFEDAVIKSKDVRQLKDSLGNVILIYSFLDNKTLVITTNEATFRELLNRYFASQIVR